VVQNSQTTELDDGTVSMVAGLNVATGINSSSMVLTGGINAASADIAGILHVNTDGGGTAELYKTHLTFKEPDNLERAIYFERSGADVGKIGQYGGIFSIKALNNEDFRLLDSANNIGLYMKDGGFVGIWDDAPDRPLAVSGYRPGGITTSVKIDATNVANGRAIPFSAKYLDDSTDLTDAISGILVANTDQTNNNYAAIIYSSEDTGDTSYTFGTMSVVFTDHAVGSKDADYVFTLRNDDALSEVVRFKGNGNVGIGATAPATSAKLEIASTTGALLIPRMTTTQKNNLTAVNGMLVYDSTLNKFQGYENGAWTNLI